MMPWLPRLGLAILGLFAAAPMATAEIAVPIEDWATMAVPPDRRSPSGYCAVQAGFSNDLSLAIARTPTGSTNLAIGFAEMRLATGIPYPVTLQIDDAVVRNLSAYAADARVLILPFGSDSLLVRGLAEGRVLVVDGPLDRASFALDGTAAALAALDRCLAVDLLAESTAAPFQTVASPAAQESPPVHQGGDGDDGLTLNLILEAAGLLDIAVVPTGHGAAPGFDFAWRQDRIYGGARENTAAMSLTETLASHRQRFDRNCGGRLVAGPVDADGIGPLTVMRQALRCTAANDGSDVELMAYGDGTLTTVFVHEGPVGSAADIARITDSIARVIRILASEP